ncbi:unnamed protein product [Lathyrus oleraceus]|uniref:[histone H3]-lysine(27) N-trimethyltransferase n=1 Tax=Pisum sativum TaxID=3888 RepID=A0A9D5A855_PEA|nr:histone-lysine N-methyltransferase EZA1 isoform X1 [Pisum sativum]KAI5399024.1 Histone-lysine N-methyltransferase ez3 [Pisum sativum]
MVSKPNDSPLILHQKLVEEPADDAVGALSAKINQLKKQIQAERIEFIGEKLQRNQKKLQCHISGIMVAISTRDSSQTEENKTCSILSSRMDHPLCKFDGFIHVSGDKDHSNQDISSVTSIKIPRIERLPPYTSWIFLDRNQRMAEDQSVVGRRRIYYDQRGSEALICSDSEEELTEPEEVKHEFCEAEDRILRMAFEEHGLNEEVLDVVCKHVGGTSLEIQERYKSIRENTTGRLGQHSKSLGEHDSPMSMYLEKTLSDALDSLDNLFCRRCLIFDCRLHGCSQPLICPSEKQTVWSEPEGNRKPCGDQCYLQQLNDVNNFPKDTTPGSVRDKKILIVEETNGRMSPPSAVEEPENQSTKLSTRLDCHGYLNLNDHVSQNLEKRKVTNQPDSRLPPDSPNSSKKLKRVSDDVVTVISNNSKNLNLGACDENKHINTSAILGNPVEHTSNKLIVPSSTCHNESDKGVVNGSKVVTNETELKNPLNSMEEQADEMLGFSDWKPLEKELYLKGVEMFGRNSCLIARNLFSGLKTCMEISSYMHDRGVSMPHRSIAAANSIMDDKGKFDTECTDQDMPSRSRLLRKRGKTRKFKYSWKSAGHPTIWKRIADGKNQSCKQYTPCECQSMCGKDCSCVNGGTCCEKYCGCSKSCKNRFRGCHCAKSQCRSRQCPCFAAGRECDPDVCRNCWVSCGDGTLGEPPRRGEGQCGNMRLLLRQQQRILLGKSDVAGWGAFLKNPVNKNDYLGEYTGELISHREADKRGKIYDRANSSFLFDLNEQFVLDAYRKGDKLKFANHSSNPNCHAKVILVAGDHRVGIFAKEHIDTSEELFYDYRYGPDQAPPWARKPEGSKRDESEGRAKKHQSH